MCRCNPSIKDPYCGRPGCYYPRPEPKSGMLYVPCDKCQRFALANLQCLQCCGLGFCSTGVTASRLERFLERERAENATPTLRLMPRKRGNKV